MIPARLLLLFLCWPTLLGAEPKKRPAKTLGLPAGIGLFSIDRRKYVPQTSGFNYEGQTQSLESKFAKPLVGTEIAKTNKDMARLITELNEYGLSQTSGKRFGDSLTLGTVTSDIEAKINASVLKTAYGLNRKWTVFAALPYIDIKIDSKLRMAGTNNALAIKDELGDIAYDEIQAGLVTASEVNIASIEDEIEAKGYAPMDHWEHSGIGDLRVGATYGEIYSLNSRVNYEYALIPKLVIPTGYVERPDILNDVGTTDNFYSLCLGLTQVFQLHALTLNLSGEYGYNFDTRRQKRVPVNDEAVIAEDRKRTINLNPGDDYEVSSGLTLSFFGFNPNYKLGYKRHFGDKYTGNLRGNYALLSAHSDSEQLYQEYGLSFDTIDLFNRKKFVYPFSVSVSHHEPLYAKNSFYDDYWQLSLTGFFGSPDSTKKGKTSLASR